MDHGAGGAETEAVAGGHGQRRRRRRRRKAAPGRRRRQQRITAARLARGLQRTLPPAQRQIRSRTDAGPSGTLSASSLRFLSSFTEFFFLLDNFLLALG